MIAYKFLDQKRVAPFTRVRWPEPGEWLESERVELCLSGVHACRIVDLPYWLQTELWKVELEGDVVEGERLVAARRGRLVGRVETWTDEVAKNFGRSCAEEARRRTAVSPTSSSTRLTPRVQPIARPGLPRSRAPGSPSFKTDLPAMRPSALDKPAGSRRRLV